MIGGDYGAGALSVSELNEYARKLLATDPLLRALEVSGEISGYKHHYSGHRYFSLKDENARVQCVMFRQHALGLDFQPADGMRVTVRASASIYPQNGSFQLYVTSMRQAGQGDLFVRFEKLKQKLLAEGLFDPARKREIPAYPRVIGVVTSQTGAAIRDIIHVARRRNPNVGIVLSPCLVQGPEAAADIVRAMDRLNRARACDVMLVGRGGGSIEDLWAFNEEIVARAIAASPIPVVSCVGHEVDFTISDFVADLRAPTPSAAAELTVPRLDQMKAEVDGMVARLAGALKSGQRLRRLALERAGASGALTAPQRILIEPRRSALDAIERRLIAAMPVRLERSRHRLDALAASLRALNPSSVMERGYAIVRQGERIVTRTFGIDESVPLRVCLSDGELTADITAVTEKDGAR
ncbi:MAG: exodeoxyribonuclease VII large subunit [Clostridia bacterium]|nr:exodeoxyribonuclease VII large subunit [Clostridia bacterium]